MSDWFDDNNTPAVSPQSSEVVTFPWVTWVLASVAICFSILWVSSRFKGDSSDDKQIKVEGTHVLVIEKDGGRDELTEGQLNIILGTSPKDWYKENEVQWRLFAESDDISKLDFWNEFKESLTLEPPAVIVTNGKKTIQYKLPKDWDAMRSKIQPLVKKGS